VEGRRRWGAIRDFMVVGGGIGATVSFSSFFIQFFSRMSGLLPARVSQEAFDEVVKVRGYNNIQYQWI